MARKLSVSDLRDLTRKRVFCRVDFNVPIESGRVTDDARITASLPTIKFLCSQGARVVLASHLGRPKGRPRPEFSLAPVAAHLASLLGQPVAFPGHTVGEAAERAVSGLAPGTVCLVENLRFHPGEEANDAAYADELARLGDVYVSDAFGSAHRAHASTVGVPSRLKPAAAGFLMQAELDHLGRLLEAPSHPFLTILGGAKVSDKMELIENLLPHVDGFLVGGAMAYTFLKAQGHPIGRSLVESEKLELARALLATIASGGKRLVLPLDHVAAVGGDDANVRITTGVALADDEAGMDIGPKTAAAFVDEINGARTVLWNGPLGRFERPAFSQGSRRVAEALAASRAVSVVGGGRYRGSGPGIRARFQDDARLHRRRRIARVLVRITATRNRRVGRRAVTAESLRPLVVGNWKMHLGESASVALTDTLRRSMPFDAVDVAIAPSFPCLRAVLDAAAGSALSVCAQNMHWEAKGPFTGEVAPAQLYEMGVGRVIIGHSERRAMFGETDATVARKVAAAMRHGLTPIVCVGENEKQRDDGRTREVVVGQVRAAFTDDAPRPPGELVVAYEPVWAIGTGRTPEPDDVARAHGAIRAALTERFDRASGAVRILYGGSVTAANAPALLRAADVNGALVGGASLDADSFLAIAAAAAAC